MGRTRYRNLFHVLTPHLDAAGLRATARTAIDLLPSTSARAALTQEIATLTRQMEAAPRRQWSVRKPPHRCFP